jgi:LPXTG-motif cell wall-anchored protein
MVRREHVAVGAVLLGILAGVLVSATLWAPGEPNSGLRTVLLIVAGLGFLLILGALLTARRRRR